MPVLEVTKFGGLLRINIEYTRLSSPIKKRFVGPSLWSVLKEMVGKEQILMMV